MSVKKKTSAHVTLQREDAVSMDHDAELQDELRSRLQEGLQEAEHGDVSTLEHQPPVELAAGPAAVPATLGAQVESVDISEGTEKEVSGQRFSPLNSRLCFSLPPETSSS